MIKKLFALVLILILTGVAGADLTSETTRVQYNCANDTTFAVSFKIFETDDVQVIQTTSAGSEDVLVESTEYTVTLDGTAPNTASVELTTACPTDSTITLLRTIEYTQETNYTAGGAFPAASHENAMDKLTMQMQQIDERLDRAPQIKKSSTLTNIEFPVEADKAPCWNSTATALTTCSTSSLTTVSSNDVSVDAVSGKTVDDLFDGDYDLLIKPSKIFGGANNTSGHTVPNVADDTFTLNAATQTLTNKTLTTPTIGNFVNSTHDHADNAGGGVLSGHVLQHVYTTKTALQNCTTRAYADDTIPQNTEGCEVFTVSITPSNTNNILVIEAVILGAAGGDNPAVVALFQDSTADALAAVISENDAQDVSPITLKHIMTAGTTSATTFKIRAGEDLAVGASFDINGDGTATRVMGGVGATTFSVMEIAQ